MVGMVAKNHWGSTRDLVTTFTKILYRVVFLTGTPPKNHKFFSVSKICRTFELGPP